MQNEISYQFPISSVVSVSRLQYHQPAWQDAGLHGQIGADVAIDLNRSRPAGDSQAPGPYPDGSGLPVPSQQHQQCTAKKPGSAAARPRFAADLRSRSRLPEISYQ
jgi:hypothetical protein